MKTQSHPHLFVSDQGSGEPVLLITGWTISSAVFDPVAPLYVPHVRAISYDHRGTGRSAPWPAPVSIAMLAADAARVLDDRGVEAAHVIGISMGAMVALELAVRMPHRVKSMVLAGGGPGGPHTRVPSLSGVTKTFGTLGADSLRHGQAWPAAALFSEQFCREQPDRVRELIRPFAQHRPPPWAVWFQTFATSCFSQYAGLKRVAAPTLVLHGDEDAMAPVANARLMAAQIPGAELHIEPGAGHAVPLERSAECAEVLLAWVARNADVVPPQRTRTQRLGERATRPFALHTGALRNTLEVVPGMLSRVRG